MNTSVHAKIKIYSYSLIGLSLILILLRILSLRFAFDVNIGYFSVNSPLPTIADAILLLSTLWAVSLFIFIPRGSFVLPAQSSSTLVQFCSALCGFIFLFVGGSAVMTYLRGTTMLSDFNRRDSILFYLFCLSCLLSAIYFFTALSSACRTAGWRIILGFFPIIWAIISLARAYFNFYIAMNDPNKVAMHLGLMAAMLFFLQELRTLLGRPQPRLMLFFSLIALLFTGVGGVAASIAPVADQVLFTDYYLDLLLIAVFWLYILLRHIDLLRSLSQPAPQPKSDESEIAE
ncbi:MAG: hypothetical protein IKL84_05245 [Clostridia bacterium]|nr:hypothetical protein [Clostridia bacterium]